MRLHYIIEFFSDWHCGSGLSAGADVDLLTVKDAAGMPFVPGKTIKGLVSEAVDNYCQFTGKEYETRKTELFGSEGEVKGRLFFSNAVIEPEQYERIFNSGTQEFLFRSVASTAIDNNGIAVDHSLRKIQVTVPVFLEGDVYGLDEADSEVIENAMKLIKRLGVNRNRGLGRCRFKDFTLANEAEGAMSSNDVLKFKCTLLSDVILNVKSASEGPNQTLDFIPGGNFLGIAAGKLYDKLTESEQMSLFHSGKVRFGDAHPLVKDFRSLRTPSAIFTPKHEKECSRPYISFLIPNPESEEMKKKQLKQTRTGFRAFIGNEAYAPDNLATSFAIKSAYDRDRRCSKDSQMYGYESLRKGLELCFEVECDYPQLRSRIKDALTGVHRVGRSSSAEYGLVCIEASDYKEIKSAPSQDIYTVVYAESRLILTDADGNFTFRPTTGDFKIEGGNICWEKSQIRTFQYAPYNYKRRCFDADRCGIEKGSVIVIKGGTLKSAESTYVGHFKNEGFGRVIYNPDFLKAEQDGLSVVTLVKGPDKTSQKPESIAMPVSVLDSYINSQLTEQQRDSKVYENVNVFLKNSGELFNGKQKFASQWGAIRGIALSAKEESKINELVIKYISHGIKSSDWKGKREQALTQFMDDNNKNIREAMVNLAAEMAKKCQKSE